MSILFDLLLAGSRIATGIGVALVVVAVAALVWLALTNRTRPGVEPGPQLPRIVEANSIRGHRRTSRPPARPVVRHPAVDEPTRVLPALRDQTELIPQIRGGWRG